MGSPVTHIGSPLMASGKVKRSEGMFTEWMTSDGLTRDAWATWQPDVSFSAGLVGGDGGTTGGSGVVDYVQKPDVPVVGQALNIIRVFGANAAAEAGTAVTSVDYVPSIANTDPMVFTAVLARNLTTSGCFAGFTSATDPTSETPILGGNMVTTVDTIGVHIQTTGGLPRIYIGQAGQTPASQTIVGAELQDDDLLMVAFRVNGKSVQWRAKLLSETNWSHGVLEEDQGASDSVIAGMSNMAACLACSSSVAANAYIQCVRASAAQRRTNQTAVFPITP